MKAILFDSYFEAPDEFDTFCKSIGYDNPNYSNNFNESMEYNYSNNNNESYQNNYSNINNESIWYNFQCK